MKNLKKIDERLFDVVSLNLHANIDCIAYVSDFTKAKTFFKEDEISMELPFINAVALKLSSSKLFDICKYSWIKSVTKQSNVLALMNVSREILGVSGVSKGDGITIAYIDTGIVPHVDFVLRKNRVVNFVDLINRRKKMYDDNGHGTFVSGVGSGNGVASGGKFSGIAPNSNIISIKALNGQGEANAIKILEAMQWIYDNVNKYDIKVVCMSFGSEPLGINDPIMKGAEVLWNKGVVMIAAGGNSGPEFETIKSPGISPKIITVGGLQDNRSGDAFSLDKFEIADFSSRGPALRRYKPDLVAPSVNIISCSNASQQLYTTMSGTSVATPMIAGMSALLIEKYPKMSPEQIKYKILSLCNGITFNRNLEGLGYPKFN